MSKDNKPNAASLGLAIFSVVVLAVSAFILTTPGISNPISVALQRGTYSSSSFDPISPVNTKQFSTVDEFTNFVKSNQGGSYYYSGSGFARSTGVMEESIAMDSMATPTAAPLADGIQKAGESGSSWDYSETNVQVKGVDEADIIKTDGNYIYTITGNTVFIIKAYPGEDAEIVSTIKFDNSPSDLFINGDKLSVFGNFNNAEFFRKIDFRPKYGMTYFNIYDISDRENPTLTKEYKFEGNYFRARMKGDYVYFVSSSMPDYRTDFPTPIIVRGEEKISMPVSDIYYFDIPYTNAHLMTVHAINLANPSDDIDSKAVFVEYNQNLYMSHDNIYITYTEQINEWDIQKKIIMQLMEPYLSDADRTVIEKIKQTDNDVLSQYEKDAKIFEIYQNYANYLTQKEQEAMQDQAEILLKAELAKYDYFEYTVVNKLGYDNGQISVDANGKVPGHIMNQFSMDENDNVFRIATTVSRRWSQFGSETIESQNNVYALDSGLNIIGKLEGLAKGEQIYSTRFMGDRLYMVTFRQVDPFFVIDLSNPRNIQNLGELKIPGFSRYLHPYDDNHIIGIGQDATETGRTTGLKISIFDVTNVVSPKETAKFVTDERYAQSTALYDHHAFLFSKEKELLVIPAYSYTYKGYNGEGSSEGYNGAFVFHITEDEIVLRGLIDHSDNSNYWSPQVERSLYIEELLYTKSPNLLRINNIEDLESVKKIELKTGTTGNIPVY
ncbi:MAG: beta-propeller domain-containing protein [Candidatus Aenigmarchaeota archaeon]|nr:beta-propeller domain-containing protein [Candidatus Aenigmarchaeota archaeon]